jgi:hypothetical protein
MDIDLNTGKSLQITDKRGYQKSKQAGFKTKHRGTQNDENSHC